MSTPSNERDELAELLVDSRMVSSIDMYDLADELLKLGYRRHPVGITDEAVHAAAVVIDPTAWEPGIFYHSKVQSAARDLSLVQARAALEAALEARQ